MERSDKNGHSSAHSPDTPDTGERVIVGTYNVTDNDTRARAGVTAPQVNRPVFLASAIGVLAITLWAFFAREHAADALGAITGWISTNLGWFYILTATVVVVFVIAVAFSRAGTIRLGPDHSRPQFRLFSWSAMLFAAGIGVDLMFFAVAEPVTQYLAPPVGEGGTNESARQAVVWALFHYGVTGWAMYALMGMAFGYYAYRLHMPLAIRSALYPLIGKRVHGRLGDAVDVAAVLGTVFGIAASLGIGVVQLNYGLKLLFGWEEGVRTQIALVVLAVGIATLSATSGVDKGIKRLSEINVVLAIGLVVYIVATGRTAFLFDALVMNIGDYVSRFPGMTMDTFAFSSTPEETTAWLGAWTLFFWAWWVAWAPFVGLFLARISRGRTLRQFVTGTLTIPFLFILAWMSFFGNTALDRVLGGDTAFGDAAMNNPQQGFYDILASSPGSVFLIGLATMIGLLLYITSADSGALVTANFTSKITDARQDGPVWLRIFWAALVGALTVIMLQIDGVATVQSATIVMGLPFTIVMYLVMLGLWRSLRLELYQTDARAISIHGAMSGRSGGSHPNTWRRRLSRASTWPNEQHARAYIEGTATQALEQVARELQDQNINATLVVGDVPDCSVPHLDLIVDLEDEQNFRYQIYPMKHPVPSFTRSTHEDEHYYRLEVFDLTGSLGYDIYGYSQEQIADNLLDLYERHLQFLHMQRDLPGTSDLSDGAQPVRQWTED